MQTAELTYENDIYFLIDFPELHKRGVSNVGDIQGDANCFTIKIYGNSRFSHIQMEKNISDNFDVIFLKERRYDRKWIDLKRDISREELKKVIYEAIGLMIED